MSSSEMPASPYARMRSATCSGVPTRFGRRPRVPTEYSRLVSSSDSFELRWNSSNDA